MCFCGRGTKFLCGDSALRVLATDFDPETIRPKRLYPRNRYFARNEPLQADYNSLPNDELTFIQRLQQSD
jgi:hypothetical protein